MLGSISSKIANYDENMANGNLVIVDFRPFLEAAQWGDFGPFSHLKKRLELLLFQAGEEPATRKMKRPRGITVFADAACTLSERREFDRCAQLERWWHHTHREWAKNNLDIEVVCPHPSSVLGREAQARDLISKSHSATLEFQRMRHARLTRPPRILVAEPEADIRAVYRRYFESHGVDAIMVESAGECLPRAFDESDPGFDAIVLDLHHRNAVVGIEAARKIRERLQGQKIIITTTAAFSPEGTGDIVGDSRKDILTKPFSLSELLALIKVPAHKEMENNDSN